MGEAQFRRSGKFWFVGDGLIWDDMRSEWRTAEGRPRECSSKLMVFNPSRGTAKVTACFYHTDRAPTEAQMRVAGGKVETLELAALPQIPHRQSFWTTVESNVPVLPQGLHSDFTFWEQTPDSLVAVRPYPGPLKDETSWTFTDCYQGGGPRGWYEQETLSILNPNARRVSVRVRYVVRNQDCVAEETLEIEPMRVV